ncbi:MAG TPA: ammonium transporter [Candidatus Acidoferrum sp.]|nr:ammonium transporter [Candidatus Acidoferrum sp.]
MDTQDPPYLGTGHHLSRIGSGSASSVPLRRAWQFIRAVSAVAFLAIALSACSAYKVDAPGDPSGTTTGTGTHLVGLAPGSITQDDLTKATGAEPFAVKLADLVDQNRLGINFTWLLVAGFLVMFMQAGFALVETGFTRAKNALHTMSMNFMIYAIGIVGFFLVGFGLAFGGLGTVGVSNLGGLKPLGSMITIGIGGTNWGIAGGTGFALTGSTYDVGVIAFFLFQLVFMDTTATIPTGSMAERFRFKPFVMYGLFVSAILYPLFTNWAWGGGWLSQLGTLGLGSGYADFAGSGVVHSIGGWCALAGAIALGPRIGKYAANGKIKNPMPGHNQILAILGTFILAFGWFGFNPGSTFGASGNGALRIGIVAVVTLLASGFGAVSAMVYTWRTEGKPNPAMMVNGMLAGLVAITAPSGFVGPIAGSIIGIVAGVLVCLAVAFFDRLRIDDPVGAISVHGVNGLWGVIATGIFADGTSNYGGFVVSGALYGNWGQLVAQIIGAITAFVWGFGASIIFFRLLDKVMPLRVSAETEIGGLDIPEMGAVGYIPVELDLEGAAA